MATDPLVPQELARFGEDFELDVRAYELRRAGRALKLERIPMELLLLLIEHRGELVTREQIVERIWGKEVFLDTDNSINAAIRKLRQALRDNPEQPRFVQTITGRGYRFVATVTNGFRTKTSTQLEGSKSSVAELSSSDDLSLANAAEAEHSSREGVPEKAIGQRRIWATISALIVIGVSVSLIAWLKHSADRPPATRAMLAVLPFENLSGDEHEDYFADGLTEEMIAQLGQLQPGKLGVIARTSTARYKHTKETVAQIGQELGVGYVLEGSVRRGGERVRVTAQLVRAAEQTHLWAETYERPLTDVLSIQKEIAEKITHSLSLQLLSPESSAAARSHVNLESYDKYLLGLHELGKGTRESGNKAVQNFQEGIAADPKDARLYAALGEAYEAMNTYYSSPSEMMPQVKAAAQRALELDPKLASAHVLLGDVHLLFDWDWAAAEPEYRRALDINPSLPEAQLGYGTYLATLGHFDEAISRVQQAYLSDPLALDTRNDALWIYYYSGRMQETVEQAKKAIELEPTAGLPYAMLARAHAQMGHRAETLQAAERAIRFASSPSVVTTTAAALARVGETRESKQVLNRALEQAKERYVCRFLVAEALIELGENEKALESLEQAFLQRST